MKIGENSGGSYQCPSLAKEDPVSANFRRQINEAKKQLQELAANKSLSAQQKSEKKQQITDTINDLNQQLRQYEQYKKQEQLKKAAQAIKERQEAAVGAVGTETEDGRTIETPSLSTETMLAMIAAESANGIVAVKEGVRMDLSHDAMRLSNTIKREENEGGVSGLRKDLNELYGQIGEITGEILGTLEEISDALSESLTENETDESTTDSPSEEASAATKDSQKEEEAVS